MLPQETELEVLRDIRGLLMLLVEPQLEERDKERRSRLRKIAGGGSRNIRAIALMDGSRTKAEITRAAPIDASQLTKLVKSLLHEGLLAIGTHNPKLLIPITEISFVRKY